MLKIAVLVSGGGTNLQAIIDEIEKGTVTNTEIAVVISNNKNAYALERAKQHNIPAVCVSPKDYGTREEFNKELLKKIQSFDVDLVVLAGCLVVIPKIMVEAYPNRIINIHPSLIPSFCGTGYYGLKVHEAALERGVKVTGATVHFVDDGTDTGPIILQKAVDVKQGDTPEILQQRVMKEAEWKIMPKAIDLIANGKIAVQDGKVVFVDKLEDC
ncbi:MAG: phosphoribosylglycinamide formyltransferase [Eubacteriales bacterium]|nr:phosphoribosylglycinamide formyltransferase [Eubacteriales bacterium]